MIRIAHGVFGWDGFERRSNRYGVFHIAAAPCDGPPLAQVDIAYEKLDEFQGKRVRVVCRVVETRQSKHIGDLFLGIRPTTPEVGEEIDLGAFIFSTTVGYDGKPDFVLKPTDSREELWINPHKLYRLHDQTVDVLIEETTNESEVQVTFDVEAEKAMPTGEGDGGLQMKTKSRKAEDLRIRPKFEKIGEGTFIMTPAGAGEPGEKFDIERKT
jgi:hypothetical protein